MAAPRSRTEAQGHRHAGQTRSVPRKDVRTLPVPRCDCQGSTAVALCAPPAPYSRPKRTKQKHRYVVEKAPVGKLTRDRSMQPSVGSGPTTPPSASSLFYLDAWSCSSRFSSLSDPFSAIPFRGRPRSPSTDWPSRSWSFAFQSPAPLRRRSRKVRSSFRCKIRFARSGRGRQLISAISSTAISSRYRPHHVHPWICTLCSWSVARPNQSVRLGSVHRCE